jgi:hypothetical protein
MLLHLQILQFHTERRARLSISTDGRWGVGDLRTQMVVDGSAVVKHKAFAREVGAPTVSKYFKMPPSD